MKITILDDYQDTIRTLPSFAKLKYHDVTVWTDHTKDTDILADRLRDTEALILYRERTPIRAPLIDRLDRLRIISQVGWYPHIDIDACTRRGIIVSSHMMPGRPSYATAELNWGLIIAAMRRIPQEDAAMRAGRWQAFPPGTALRGKTLGIYGYGRIGPVVAGYGKAFGMNVIVWSREASLAKARADGFTAAASKHAFFAEADVLSIHLALNEATRSIITAADLALMKSSALIVNTSRAGLIAPGVLTTALRSGRPRMAALDVFDDEPVTGADDPLLAMDNVVCTPHIGYVELGGLDGMFGVSFDQVLAYAHGEPVNVINSDALAHARRA
ncbi:MAG TPA: D-2-hydroxyacid dehydrogenase family protein [Candidatus Binataceae bacterium]|nr:D-2-hydroxyacid dehydrogenase family protein [Candidatus Binataceae bacterium]